jgi:hypothetical protein
VTQHAPQNITQRFPIALQFPLEVRQPRLLRRPFRRGGELFHRRAEEPGSSPWAARDGGWADPPYGPAANPFPRSISSRFANWLSGQDSLFLSKKTRVGLQPIAASEARKDNNLGRHSHRRSSRFGQEPTTRRGAWNGLNGAQR